MIRLFSILLPGLTLSFCSAAQNQQRLVSAGDSIPNLNLRQCIQFAMEHQPALQRTLIGQDIARKTNQIALSGWLPQLSANGTLTHYFQLPSSTVSNTSSGNTGSSPTTSRPGASRNIATPGVSATQALFSPDLLYAAKSAKYYLQLSRQVTDSAKIYLVSSVSKSFYSLLLTLEQINVLKDDTARLGRNLNDTYHQYKSGIVDETDYDEADISLSNARTQLRQATENIPAQYAQLKLLIGFQPEKQFNVSFDTLQMKRDIGLDTISHPQFENRIEYQQLKTEAELQHQLVTRYRYGFIPTISAFYNYTDGFQNNTFSNIFVTAFPSSYAGLSVSFPIFTGLGRLRNLQKARLQQKLIELDQTDLRALINFQYASAMASYKSNLYSMKVLEKNVEKAKRVYFIVGLQYKQGIIPYLNVITAESNLISSEIGYINALFQVLSSKIDVQKAMGTITY